MLPQVFKCRLTGDGEEPVLDDLELAASSLSVRRYSGSESVSIVVPGIEHGDDIEARLHGNIIIDWYLNEVLVETLVDVPIDGLSIAAGANSQSITIHGKFEEPVWSPGDTVDLIAIKDRRYDSNKSELAYNIPRLHAGLVPGVNVAYNGSTNTLISAQIECSFLSISVFLVTEAAIVPSPASGICDSSGYCSGLAATGLVWNEDYSESIRLGYISPVHSQIGRYTAFVYILAPGIEKGTVADARLTFPGGTWSFSSSDYAEYDIKAKIYLAAVDSASIPADRNELLGAPKTSAFAQWHYDPTDYPIYTPIVTPDFSAALQELIDRPGYTPTSNIMMIIQSDEYPAGGVSRWALTLIQYPSTAQDYPVEFAVSYQ